MKYNVFRGEHGACEDLSTRHASITFCDDWHVARTYALRPNDSQDISEKPRIIHAEIQIAKPLGYKFDPFIEFSELAYELGVENTKRIMLLMQHRIAETSYWQDHLMQTYKTVEDLIINTEPSEDWPYCSAFYISR